MVTVQGISNYDKKISAAITIGTFDGVHIGHRKILDRLIGQAKAMGLKSAVLTFFPHPRTVLQKDTDIKLLNTMEEKTKILTEMGLDFLIIHPFTKEFSRLSANEFVLDILVKGLSTKKIIIGYDHRFGRNRTANIADLKTFGGSFGFDVEEIPAQEIDAVFVSSTKIRHALENGDIKTANSYLGYMYMLTGVVAKGKGLGKQMKFPTANLYIKEPHKLIPKNGVYAVRSVVNHIPVSGMMNIGYNPTVSGTEKTIEIHFFDIDKDLYGQKLQIDIVDRIRDEHKFGSLEELKNQLVEDRKTAIALIEK